MMLPNLTHAMAGLFSRAGAGRDRPAQTARSLTGRGCTTQLCSPAHATNTLGQLRELTTDLAVTVARLDRYLQNEHAAGRLNVVEGPFTGDPASAVSTTHLWLTEASATIDALREELDNAHISAGGLTPQRQ